MVKGISPTLKTPPGGYPLVVTAEFRRTSDSWQLEGPAVCVPLISSTGHGDAALHRVHYQEGKFALANLLVALLPNNPAECDARYLYHLLMARKDELLVPLMQGTANVSLKVEDIAGVEVSLPSIAEQRRVATRIEELTTQIMEARSLRHQANAEANVLLRSIIANDEHATLTPIRELVKLRPPDVKVCAEGTYKFAGVYSFGRGVFQGAEKSGMEFAYTRLTRIRGGDFIYPKLMAWEGAFGVVPPECEGCFVSPEFPVFEVDEERIFHEVMDVYFRTPSVWPKVAGESTGTNVRRRRLHPTDFLEYQMPVPSRETQLTLRKVKAQVDVLKRLQSKTAAELDALLPAILDRAFKGQL